MKKAHLINIEMTRQRCSSIDTLPRKHVVHGSRETSLLEVRSEVEDREGSFGRGKNDDNVSTGESWGELPACEAVHGRRETDSVRSVYVGDGEEEMGKQRLTREDS